jgi:hypothetical protein
LIIIKLTSSLILLFIPLLLGTLLYKLTGLEIFFIYAEDVISIIPGSANYDPSYQFSITRFFDNNFFPIKKNNTLTSYNADNVEHTILLSFKTELLLPSRKLLNPKVLFLIHLSTMNIIIFHLPSSIG